MGDRLGVALLDGGKGQAPTRVVVLQVTDTTAAKAVADDVAACIDFGSHRMSHVFSGEWLVLAGGDDAAEDLVVSGTRSALAHDDEFRRWVGEAGEPGIVTSYVAPLAAKRLSEIFIPSELRELDPAAVRELEEEAESELKLDTFEGAGAVVRFDQGALELEVAGSRDFVGTSHLAAAGDLVGTLPKSTAAAVGIGMAENGFDVLLDEVEPLLEKELGLTVEKAEAELKKAVGLDFDDLRTLLDDAVVVALDSSIEGTEVTSLDASRVPLGFKLRGDTKAIERVIDKIREASVDRGQSRDFLISRVSGEFVIVAFDEEYASKLAHEDGLGFTESFRVAAPDAERSVSTFYVDFNDNDWLDGLLEDLGAPQEVRGNLAPLDALGMTSWNDDGTAHMLLRLSTDADTVGEQA